MASLADVIVDASDGGNSGNSSDARKALTEAVTESPRSEESSSTNQQADDGLPAKFKGKSAKEVVDMYQNLERSHGTLANELGVQRQLTDRFLQLKRTDDLIANGGKPERVKPAPVTTNDLLDRPQETLERVVNDRVQTVQDDSNERISRLEGQLAKTVFENRHPGYQQTVSSPEFLEWVKASPLRLRAAGVANAGNWVVADELFTEYAGTQTNKSRTDATNKQSSREENLESARSASFTSSGSNANDGQSKPSGKVYKRSDLMKLRIEDPDAYYDEDFQKEILRAHHEKRVR